MGDDRRVDYFIDTEFIDLEREIELISLGVVAADGREFYAVSTEFDASRANEFVKTVVIPLLEPPGDPVWMSRARMKDELVKFIGDDVPRFWSWAGAPWDWLAMAQLFPVEERVPDGWRYTAYDVSQLAEDKGFRVSPVDPGLPQAPAKVHHALADARWARKLYEALGGPTGWPPAAGGKVTTIPPLAKSGSSLEQ
jgi:hypothetical protein